MGTGGPGNIVHIDNLYVKDFPVKTDSNIILGDFVIFDSTGVRTILTTDFGSNDTFLDIQTKPVYQAGESANNLASTPVANRKTTCECLTRMTDWVTIMRAGAMPDQSVGILRVDSATPVFQVAHQRVGTQKPVSAEILGHYKHKEFSTIALLAVQGDNGIVATGGGLA